MASRFMKALSLVDDGNGHERELSKILNEPSHRYFLIDIVVSLKTYDRFGESFRNFFNYLETFIST